MKMSISFCSLIALLVLSPVSLSRAGEVTRKYSGATRLMGVAAKAKYEGKDEIAWGEYARAYDMLGGIRKERPNWNTRTVASSMERCRREMDVLEPASVAASREITDGQLRSLELLSRADSQNKRMADIINDMKRRLNTAARSRAAAALPEGGETSVAAGDSKDTDGDGLTDEEEKSLETSPIFTDTDNDGLSDFDEVRKYGTNPLVTDTDQDGLTDNFEVTTFKTDPLNPDCDGEGLLDGDEYRYGTDPHNSDTDGDDAEVRDRYGHGGNDREEIEGGYDPLTHINDQ